MGICNGCEDPTPIINEESIECCELIPANCVVTTKYQDFFKIGVGKTLTYAIDTIAKFVKANKMRIDDLETIHNYSSYVSILNQSLLVAPTETSIVNGIGGTSVLARSAAGKYTLTLTGAFTANKTFITLGEFNIGWGEKVKAYWVDVNTIAIESGSSTDYIDDNVIVDMPIEIRVYD